MTLSLFVVSDRPKCLPVLLHALRNQTYEDWRCMVLDQGDGSCALEAMAVGDKRIGITRVARAGDWGYSARCTAVQLSTADVVGFPQDDAYYCPVYLGRLMEAIDAGAALAYCDWVFDKMNYGPCQGRPQVGRIDLGGFLVRRAAFEAVGGFVDRGDTADGQLVERLVASGAPAAHVPGCFYVKN